MSVLVRMARVQDAKNLSVFAKNTFVDTYAGMVDRTELLDYSNETFHLDNQLNEIINPDNLIFLAEDDESNLLGYALIQYRSLKFTHRVYRQCELKRIYLSNKVFRKGIGTRLLNAVKGTLSKQGIETLYVGVWDKNSRALAFYFKNGFKEVADTHFELGNQTCRDLVLQCAIEHIQLSGSHAREEHDSNV
jgi:diamine N-acetyltransferase